jgi:3-deoxy-D-manno-oct-2-ulosonic acid (Kdo) hydroxylase
MTLLETLDIEDWDDPISKDTQNKAIQSLEEGRVLYFPSLAFSLYDYEHQFLSDTILEKGKNISYDDRTDCVRGAVVKGQEQAEQLKQMLRRYSNTSHRFLQKILPHYHSYLAQGKTSFRPVEIAGRKTSYRKDDTRLHVDAFPSSPTKGQRILRIFTNINHEGKSRIWRLGEPLEDVLNKFLPKASVQIWGVATLLKWLGITKDYRTPYDHYMLCVHDMMKGDEHYQKVVSQETISFPPACSWMVYTDQVSHAAMSGQHALERTFHIPLKGLKNESTAPLRVMERLLDRTSLT